MKRLSRKSRIFLLLILCALALPLLWFGVFTSGPSRKVAATLRSLHALTIGSEAPIVSTRIRIESAEGIPKEIVGRSVELNFQAPAHVRVSTVIDENDYHLGRDGESIWISVPHKKLAIEGRNNIPRFAGYPDSIQEVNLPDLRSPLKNWQLFLLPVLIRATEADDGSFSCQLRPYAAKKLGIPTETKLSLQLDSRDWPSWIGITGDGFDLKLKVERFEVDRTSDSSAHWAIPKTKDVETEKVALAHLERFVKVILKNIDSKLEPLPPVTGEKKLIATHGKGRLEVHDGTKVLFLNGTPEEIGEQHGTLLKDEVNGLVDRIVYGAGVASTFEKGKWFIGEIEEAVERLKPFTDERHLREIKALGVAAGMHPQEIRLANFFPELFHCTGFALHGKATVGGRMYHGRVLDYLRGLGLEENAVVMIIKPDQGNAWVNVGYAGFTGTVTAMNEKHIAIGEMGGGGEGDWDGKPMAQLMREVMEKASTVDEAVEIMRNTPRTCEYYYVVSDANTMRSVGIKATPEIFETIWSGESHPQLSDPVEDTVLLSSGDRYKELVKRVKSGWGKFNPDSARELMSRPVCMKSNIQSVLFAPDTLDFWVANADSANVASETRYTKYNLGELLKTGAKNEAVEASPSLSYAKEIKN